MRTGDSDMDKFIFDLLTKLLAYMAQTERKKIRERQRQGIEIAKANGKYRGTRPLTPQTHLTHKNGLSTAVSLIS